MTDEQKSPAELLEELETLRTRVAELDRAVRQLRISEMELATNAYRLQSILDNTTAVIYVKDLEGHYFTVNHQYEQLFDVKREDMLGRTDFEIFPKDMAEAFRANDLKVIEADAPLEFEEVAPHDDGPHTYISIKFPLRNSLGNLEAVGGISTDITERKNIEEELRVALERLKKHE